MVHRHRHTLPIVFLMSLILCAGQTVSAATELEQAVAQLQGLNHAFTTIAKHVTASVVTISTKQTVERPTMDGREFRFHPFNDPRFRERQQEEERDGLGSGIVMSADGYILTNHHVAGGANQITVIFNDNREFEAKLVGADSLTDVAVIKIDAKGLTPATMGNSDKLQIGEWVLAIGAPMSLRSTVTSGIISAMGRNINILRDSYAVEDFIQTDAASNPGNSGGALVNLRGELIGINTAIATPTRTFVGYGFAIPINLARKVMDDIIAYGRVRRGFLGVSLGDVDASLADAFGMDRPRGVLVVNVFSDTPAETAGLRSEDIILKVDNQEVNRPNHVQSLIARKHPDDTVSMEIRRKDKTLTLNVKLGERDNQVKHVAAAPPTPGESEHYGLTVQNITPEIASSIGLSEDVEGIIVSDIGRGPAREAGFRPGDIIYRVRQGRTEQDIRSVEDFKTTLGRLEKGRNAAFAVRRGGFPAFITMKIPE